jgi:osmotically-inducible protein OsmY
MLRRLFALVVLIALVLGGLYYWQARTGRRLPGLPKVGGKPVEALKDAKTMLSVKTALGLPRSLEPYSIDVESENGVVTLRGKVPREDLRALAERTAAAVPNVSQVVDHIEVDAAAEKVKDGAGRTLGESLDDEALAVKVRLAFSLHRALEGTDIDVRARRRQVTLSGRVARPEQKRIALAVARETANVESVNDQISVGGGEASALDRRAAVEKALRSNPNLAAYRLTVREEAGHIVVAGRVRNATEKDLAGLVAREAAGQPVDNAIAVGQVKPGGKRGL